MFVHECIALSGKHCQMLCVYNICVVFGACLSLKSMTKSKHDFIIGSMVHGKFSLTLPCVIDDVFWIAMIHLQRKPQRCRSR